MGEIHYKQVTLKKSLNKKTKWQLNDPRAAPFHDVVVQYIIGENKSFNTIEQPFFVNMLHKFKPVYRVPGRTYFTRKLIPQAYKEMNSNLHKLIGECSYVSFITTFGQVIMQMTLLLD